MAFIIWNERYDTGIEKIDLQHRKLVGLINVLFDAIPLKDRQEILNQTLTELVNYTIYHFKLEEELMIKYNYVDFQDHKDEHVLFIEKINRYMESLQVDNNKILLNLISFLKDWLLKHIMDTDKKYITVIPSFS